MNDVELKLAVTGMVMEQMKRREILRRLPHAAIFDPSQRDPVFDSDLQLLSSFRLRDTHIAVPYALEVHPSWDPDMVVRMARKSIRNQLADLIMNRVWPEFK